MALYITLDSKEMEREGYTGLTMGLAEYTYLETTFKAIESQTGKLADPFSGATFRSEDLNVIDREIGNALEKAKEMADIVEVIYAYQNNSDGTNVPLNCELKKDNVIKSLKKIQSLVQHAKNMNLNLYFVGD